MPTALQDWSSTQRQTDAGAVESMQRARLREPAVEQSEEGARRLGAAYWDTVERRTRGLVRAHERTDELELRVLRRGPALLRFASPELRVSAGRVECRYPIRGGLLARTPAGAITLGQHVDGAVEVTSVIDGFFPRLAARPGRPSWTGALYAQVQSRLHVAVSRDYFDRLAAGTRK